MRFIIDDSQNLTLDRIATALQQVDPAYSIVLDPLDELRGDLLYDETFCGEIEINHPGDEIFEDDIAELKEFVEGTGSPHEQHIMTILDNAKELVAVNARWQGTDAEPILQRIDPLWDWLFHNHRGLLQADNEGFYDHSGLILELNLKL